MPAWGPFLAVSLLLLGLLLVLARLSQGVIDEYAPERDDDSEQNTDGQTAESVVREGSDESRELVEESSKSVSDEHRESIDQQPVEPPHEPPFEQTNAHTTESSRDTLGGIDASTDTPGGVDASTDTPERVDTTGDSTDEAFDDRSKPDQPREDLGEEIVLTPQVLMANVAITQVLVVLVLVVAAWYFEIPAAAFGITADAMSTGLPAVATGVVFGAVLWVANELSTTLADAVGASYDEQVREMLAPESPQGWILLFGGVLPLIAVGEELLFRAALIGVPEAAYGINVWILAIGSSLAFALGHGAQGRVGVVVTGALGFVLAAGYIYTGSLLVVIVAHYVINALEFLVHEYLEFEGFSPEAIGL